MAGEGGNMAGLGLVIVTRAVKWYPRRFNC